MKCALIYDKGRFIITITDMNLKTLFNVILCFLLTPWTVQAQEAESNPNTLWKVTLKGPLMATPAVQGDTLYIPMSDNKLYRMHLSDGRSRKILDLKGTASVAPVIDKNRIYLSLTGQKKKDRQELVGVDLKTGAILWQRPLRNGWSAPTLSDETLYIGSEDGHLYAVETRSGALAWKFRAGRAIRSSPVISDGVVFAGSDDNHLYALDARAGKLRWSYRAGGSVVAAPAVAGSRVYAAGYDNKLYCLDKTTGALQWTFSAESSLYGAPVVHRSRVFIGSNDRHLYALDATSGHRLWSFQTDGVIRTAPAAQDGTVYVASSDRHVYALDTETGALQWKYETGGSVSVSPTLINGVLIIGSEDRRLHAVRDRRTP